MLNLTAPIRRKLALPNGSQRVEDYLARRWPIRDWDHEYRNDNIRVRALPMPPDPWLYLAHRWAVEWWEDEWQWLGDVEPEHHPFHMDHLLYIVPD